MLAKSLAILGLASGITAQSSPLRLGQKFGLSATGNGIPGNSQVIASVGRLLIGGTQDATCDNDVRQDYATFALRENGSLYLWGKETGSPTQQVWVDGSGMGQGISGYTTGEQPGPRNLSRGEFAADPVDGSFKFQGAGAKACPTSTEGEWSLWFTTIKTPGNQDGCVDVALTAFAADARAGCEYSSSE